MKRVVTPARDARTGRGSRTSYAPKRGKLVAYGLTFALATLLGLGVWTLLRIVPIAHFYTSAPAWRPSQTQFVYDYAHTLPPETQSRLNQSLATLRARTGADIAILTLKTPPREPLPEWTKKQTQEWSLAASSHGRLAAMLVVVPIDQAVCLYAGEELVPIWTPSLITHINQRQFTPYFHNGDLKTGIERTTRLLSSRLLSRELWLKRRTAPTGETAIASALPALDAATDKAIQQTSALLPTPSAAPSSTSTLAVAATTPPETYDAQPTPRQTVEKYLQANRWQRPAPLGIYDGAANRALRAFGQTPEQMSGIYQHYENARIKIQQQGDRAVALFPQDPDYRRAPLLLRKTARGWQIDGKTFSGLIAYNDAGQWRFTTRQHPYAFAFHEYEIDRNGYAQMRSASSRSDDAPREEDPGLEP